MRTLLVSALALGAMGSAALAEPIALADAQMDAVTAGQITTATASSSTSIMNMVSVIAEGRTSVTIEISTTAESSASTSASATPPENGNDGSVALSGGA